MEKAKKSTGSVPVLPGANGISEDFGRVSETYFHPSQAYFQVPYNQFDARHISRPSYQDEEPALQNIEQLMGVVGYLIRSLDRWGARSAWALVRASEEYPTAEYPSRGTVNGMLLANALQINGDGKYVGPKALFNIPAGPGKGRGTYTVMDKLHLLFLQEGGLIFKHAEAQGFVYIVGMEEVLQRQRIEKMVRSGTYQLVEEHVTGSSDGRHLLVGTSPDGGEIVTAELWPLSCIRVDIHPGAKYKTTEGFEHGIVIYKKHHASTTATPVGWVAAFDKNQKRYELVDQGITLRMFGLEYIRTEGYRGAPKEKQRELDTLGVGSISIALEGRRRPDVPTSSLIDPSANGKVNITSTWTNLYHTYRALTTHQYDPAHTQLRTLARIREALNKDKRQVNTILTGHVVAQMLEILYPSLPDAYPDIRASVAPSEDTRQLFEPVLERVALPEEALSVWYQIAEYFQLEDANGAAVIQEKGQLTSPQVDTWSASIILSIAVIIVEQLLVQYLAPGSIHYGMESVFGQNLHHLAEALGEPTFVEAVQLEARRIDGEKTVFGRQRSDCHRLVETIRSYTGLSTIIEMLQKSDYARFTTDPKAQQALFSLKKMGRVLQESTFASFASKQGKGINAGIDIIIHHYCPEGQPIVL